MSKKKDKKNLELESQNVADVVEALEAETDSSVTETAPVLETTVEEAAPKKISKKDKKKVKKNKKDKLVQKKRKVEKPDEQLNDDPSLVEIFRSMFASKKKKPEPIIQKSVKRVKTDYQTGLSIDQVNERISKGQINVTPNANNKTIKSIVFENIFTFFNISLITFFITITII